MIQRRHHTALSGSRKPTFDGPPVIIGSSTIRVYRRDSTLLDTIDTAANIVTT
ncbi:hypothetical protein [Sphingomonas sp. PAMC 26605]|uniref:hypothetical protein n=1 Tax=Sphingomonas sp. PAMC 26605 TaxID=1112214 RepID=UPI0002FC95C3|nr:hypothetical protein [Sphingomonas sp. PAMC 26605]